MFPRLTHRAFRRGMPQHAPDVQYVMNGLQKPSYKQVFQNNMAKMQAHSLFLERYFNAAAAMQRKGKVPIVTAQASLYRAPRILIETLSGRKEGEFRFLSQPSHLFQDTKEDLFALIEEIVEKEGEVAWTPGRINGRYNRLDQDKRIKEKLKSASYVMMDFAIGESAFHYVFSNSSASTLSSGEELGVKEVAAALKRHGLEQFADEVTLWLRTTMAAYQNLDLGTAWLIGIPEDKLLEFLYDSKSFGVPTGLDIRKVVRGLSSSPRAHSDEEGGPQCRLMINKKALNRSSGIEMIDLMNPDEVKAFCCRAGHTWQKGRDIPFFGEVFAKGTTNRELKQMRIRRQLDTSSKNMGINLLNRKD